MSRAGYTLTANAARRIGALLRRIPQDGSAPDRTWRDGAKRAGWIVGSTSIAANRWEYDFVPADDPTQTLVAFNWHERANTATFAAPSYDIASLPGTFAVLPIGEDKNGVLANVGVECVYQRRDNVLAWWLDETNGIDGDCDGGGGGGGGGYPEELGYAGL